MSYETIGFIIGGVVILLWIILNVVMDEFSPKKQDNRMIINKQLEHLDFDRKLGRINDQEFESKFRELEKRKR